MQALTEIKFVNLSGQNIFQFIVRTSSGCQVFVSIMFVCTRECFYAGKLNRNIISVCGPSGFCQDLARFPLDQSQCRISANFISSSHENDDVRSGCWRVIGGQLH